MSVSCLNSHLPSLPLRRRRNQTTREKASPNRVRNLDTCSLQTPQLVTVRERGLQSSNKGGVYTNRIGPAFSCQTNCHLTKLFITSLVSSKPYPDSILCHCEARFGIWGLSQPSGSPYGFHRCSLLLGTQTSPAGLCSLPSPSCLCSNLSFVWPGILYLLYLARPWILVTILFKSILL